MDKRNLLSLLWVFLVVNFIFCDVFTLMYSEDLKKIITGTVDGIDLNQEFLLTFAFIMEIPMLMIIFSKVLRPKLNKVLNITFALFLALIQFWSLTAGPVTLHYIFFSIIEIGACLTIAVMAWTWSVTKH